MLKLSEKQYIQYRKLKALGNQLVFMLCCIFPINRNKIAVCTFEGKGGFGDNPRYIVEELQKRNPKYQFVWLVNEPGHRFPDYVKAVKNSLWSRAYHLSTSKIWIDNYRKPYGTRKRKNQYYFQTWHATIGFKSIGLWRGKAFSKMAYLVSKNDSEMIDYVITDSEWCDEMYPKGLVYKGNFLRAGAPRCDVLYGSREEAKKAVRKKYHLDQNAKIVMFAPTFREGSVDGVRRVFSEAWTLDFKRMLDSLSERFSGEWYLCVRVHPQLAAQMNEYSDKHLDGRIIDASKEDDMCEILAGMDAFVTDYSSAAMDASFADMPVFIYADDMMKYIGDRGSILWDFHKDSYETVRNNKKMTPGIDTVLPYPIAQNNDELEYNIRNFDEKKYRAQMNDFVKAVALVFDGRASRKVADRIEKCIRKTKRYC